MLSALAIGMGGTVGRLAALALTVPQRFTPKYVHLGRTVYLQRLKSVDAPSVAQQPREHDPLVPHSVRGRSPLRAHRMISYRARLLEILNVCTAPA
jgi:hypothetical protein